MKCLLCKRSVGPGEGVALRTRKGYEYNSICNECRSGQSSRPHTYSKRNQIYLGDGSHMVLYTNNNRNYMYYKGHSFTLASVIATIKYKRVPKQNEMCHHIDGNPSNDRLDNIELIDGTTHWKKHFSNICKIHLTN